MSLTNDQIIEAIGEKSVLEIVELISAMEEKFGVSAAAVAAGPAAAAEAVEEQTEFNVVLASFGDNKVAVIKAVRAFFQNCRCRFNQVFSFFQAQASCAAHSFDYCNFVVAE